MQLQNNNMQIENSIGDIENSSIQNEQKIIVDTE
jgi:hypothetical protein